MTEKLSASLKSTHIGRLVSDERRLLLERTALVEMLKNVQALRTRLKVEQMQLTSNLQSELGELYVEVPAEAIPAHVPINMEQEESNLAMNKPVLDLEVNNFQSMFYDDIEEEDDEDSDGAGCVQEVCEEFDHEMSAEIDFDNF